MDWKNIVKDELEEVRKLANYLSDDLEATKRLQKIREKAEAALKAMEQSGQI